MEKTLQNYKIEYNSLSVKKNKLEMKKSKIKKGLFKILGKYKVIGDTIFGLSYKEAEKLADEIIELFTQKEWCESCKGWVMPTKKKLQIGGNLHSCPKCGLSLSA